MVIIWDKGDPNMWLGKTEPDGKRPGLRLFVERLPNNSGWDWSVWDLAGPRVSGQGVKRTATEATMAAEMVTLLWDQVRKDHEMP
jgi:hypothetical protein